MRPLLFYFFLVLAFVFSVALFFYEVSSELLAMPGSSVDTCTKDLDSAGGMKGGRTEKTNTSDFQLFTLGVDSRQAPGWIRA